MTCTLYMSSLSLHLKLALKCFEKKYTDLKYSAKFNLKGFVAAYL